MSKLLKMAARAAPDPASVRISRLRRNPEVGTQTPGGFRPSLPSNHAQARQWHLLVIKPPETDVIASTRLLLPDSTRYNIAPSANKLARAPQPDKAIRSPFAGGAIAARFFSEPGRSWSFHPLRPCDEPLISSSVDSARAFHRAVGGQAS
jgi:hypothetical protein